MNRSINLILLVAAAMIFGIATEANAQGRDTISARVGNHAKGVKFGKSCQRYRVNNCGKPLKHWCQQVAYRSNNDTFVYRSQNKATTRHDEVSSHAIIFHVKCGKIRCGHVYQKRGN